MITLQKSVFSILAALFLVFGEAQAAKVEVTLKIAVDTNVPAEFSNTIGFWVRPLKPNDSGTDAIFPGTVASSNIDGMRVISASFTEVAKGAYSLEISDNTMFAAEFTYWKQALNVDEKSGIISINITLLLRKRSLKFEPSRPLINLIREHDGTVYLHLNRWHQIGKELGQSKFVIPLNPKALEEGMPIYVILTSDGDYTFRLAWAPGSLGSKGPRQLPFEGMVSTEGDSETARCMDVSPIFK